MNHKNEEFGMVDKALFSLILLQALFFGVLVTSAIYSKLQIILNQ